VQSIAWSSRSTITFNAVVSHSTQVHVRFVDELNQLLNSVNLPVISTTWLSDWRNIVVRRSNLQLAWQIIDEEHTVVSVSAVVLHTSCYAY